MAKFACGALKRNRYNLLQADEAFNNNYNKQKYNIKRKIYMKDVLCSFE